MDPRFEWDRRKAAINDAQHGVSFKEALTVFSDPLARIFDDPDHSSTEAREIIIGTRTRSDSSSSALPRGGRRCSTLQCQEGDKTGAPGL
jgi:uncharacterized DUF497 family protein